MANEVKLPSLGDNIASGDVVDVKVKVGDVVQKGQALIEVEAEKTTAEVPTPFAGKELEAPIRLWPHQNRLDDAVGRDRGR